MAAKDKCKRISQSPPLLIAQLVPDNGWCLNHDFNKFSVTHLLRAPWNRSYLHLELREHGVAAAAANSAACRRLQPPAAPIRTPPRSPKVDGG